MEWFLFIIGGAMAIGASLAVILERSPLRGALWLIVALCGLAVLFIDLGAGFVAIMQVLVYAGAIMVLFLFVIMLLNLGDDQKKIKYFSVSKMLGTISVIALLYLFVRAAADVGFPQGGGRAVDGSVKAIGVLMFTDYLFALEAIGILLLVAIVGPVVMGIRRRETPHG